MRGLLIFFIVMISYLSIYEWIVQFSSMRERNLFLYVLIQTVLCFYFNYVSRKYIHGFIKKIIISLLIGCLVGVIIEVLFLRVKNGYLELWFNDDFYLITLINLAWLQSMIFCILFMLINKQNNE